MLDYVGYRLDDLRATYRSRVAAANLETTEAETALAALEAGLTGYTYLHEGA
jgi:arginine decarboxylase